MQYVKFFLQSDLYYIKLICIFAIENIVCNSEDIKFKYKLLNMELLNCCEYLINKTFNHQWYNDKNKRSLMNKLVVILDALFLQNDSNIYNIVASKTVIVKFLANLVIKNKNGDDSLPLLCLIRISDVCDVNILKEYIDQFCVILSYNKSKRVYSKMMYDYFQILLELKQLDIKHTVCP